ncbi:MAG: M3 family oligoendopeptidase [Ilumatobacteraceae bacterium]
MTTLDPQATADSLPRWSTTDLYESFESRAFRDAMERTAADVARLEALFDEHGIRAIEPRDATAEDGAVADAVLRAMNDFLEQSGHLEAYLYAATTTNSFDEQAQGFSGEFRMHHVRVRPLTARFAEWVASLGVDSLAPVSTEVLEHREPLLKLVARAEHQMSEAEEGLYAELTASGSAAWSQLQQTVTSQLTAAVPMPDGTSPELPIAAVRGLATNPDPSVRKAAYEAEMSAWPTVTATCAAAMNGVKGEANVVNRRRNWSSPLDASLFANNVSRPTFDAMHDAVSAALPDLRRWMRVKARLHGHEGGLPWWDLVAPLPFAGGTVSWDDGLQIVRHAFASYGGSLAGLVDRAIDERWIDAAPRAGKAGGAYCMPFIGDRSLVFLNWSGSAEAAQITAHELGHAYHNTQLAQRTPMQRALPMALAETASIFCETLVVEEGLERLEGRDRLTLLDTDLQGTNQVIVDIRSRFIFETEVFARRQRRTLGPSEMNEMMVQAQAEAYGDGIDQSTAHPYMWALKPHYYGSHFYNWPYTYGLLFGLGLFAQYRNDPERFQAHYDDALSRAGMNTAEELGAVFGFDVTDSAFWTASLDVVRARVDAYESLAAEVA